MSLGGQMNKRKEKFEDILRYRFTAWAKETLKNAKLKYLYTELRRIHRTISLEECDEKICIMKWKNQK